MNNEKAVTREIATGSGATTLAHTVDSRQRLVGVKIKLSSAPTTPGDIVIMVSSSVSITLFLVVDPSDYTATSIVWYPEDKTILVAGDTVSVTYTNADGRTYGATITMIEEE